MYYIANFIIFSIFGYFFETIFFAILSIHKFSGFTMLWWTPFYGLGVIIAILLYKLCSRIKLRGKTKLLTFFLLSFLALSILELIGGIILENLFGYPLWNYEVIPLHVGKFISVPTSFAWALFSLFYIYIIKKYTDIFIKKVPKFIFGAIFIIFMIDAIYSIYNLLYAKMPI